MLKMRIIAGFEVAEILMLTAGVLLVPLSYSRSDPCRPAKRVCGRINSSLATRARTRAPRSCPIMGRNATSAPPFTAREGLFVLKYFLLRKGIPRRQRP